MPIFDQGYQNWTGPISGYGWRWLVVTRHGVKAQLKGKIVRLLLVAAWLPAIALVTVLVLWGLFEQQAESVVRLLRQMLPAEMMAQPQAFRSAVWTVAYSFFFKTELAFTLFLVMIVGPNLISRDLRFNAMPLYFSRPLRRFDYFLGKLGVIGFYLAAIAVVPAAVAYLVGVAFSLDVKVVRDTHRLLWGGALYGMIITISAGTLMLALSSLSRRSIYVGLAWAGFCFLTALVSTILVEIRYDMQRHDHVRERMEKWIATNPPPPGVSMSGINPLGRGFRNSRMDLAPEELAAKGKVDKWQREWGTNFSQFQMESEESRNEQGKTDWRPVFSFSNNLDRLGDMLLGTDAAWVVFGKATERPRAAFGPAIQFKTGIRIPELSQPVNDRLLADRMVWQFPWYWSAGVLAGLFVLSIGILMSRVKSLDRLK